MKFRVWGFGVVDFWFHVLGFIVLLLVSKFSTGRLQVRGAHPASRESPGAALAGCWQAPGKSSRMYRNLASLPATAGFVFNRMQDTHKEGTSLRARLCWLFARNSFGIWVALL